MSSLRWRPSSARMASQCGEGRAQGGRQPGFDGGILHFRLAQLEHARQAEQVTGGERGRLAEQLVQPRRVLRQQRLVGDHRAAAAVEPPDLDFHVHAPPADGGGNHAPDKGLHGGQIARQHGRDVELLAVHRGNFHRKPGTAAFRLAAAESCHAFHWRKHALAGPPPQPGMRWIIAAGGHISLFPSRRVSAKVRA